MPGISGSGNYKGFVEVNYAHTLAGYNGDFIGVTTSQGYQYSTWFFIGAGLGFDYLFAHKNQNWGNGWWDNPHYNISKEYKESAPMLPLFSDFRFLVGNQSGAQNVSFFLSLKIGCSFLLTSKYIAIGDGYLTNQEYFFLNPSIGIRIPINSNKPKQAFDIGVSYKLLTSNYWYRNPSNITLQGLGAVVGFEW